MKTNQTTIIIITAIAVLAIGTIVYYVVAQRKSSFEDGDMPLESGSPDMSDDESDAPMASEIAPRGSRSPGRGKRRRCPAWRKWKKREPRCPR
jgi:hypothetical protein